MLVNVKCKDWIGTLRRIRKVLGGKGRQSTDVLVDTDETGVRMTIRGVKDSGGWLRCTIPAEVFRMGEWVATWTELENVLEARPEEVVSVQAEKGEVRIGSEGDWTILKWRPVEDGQRMPEVVGDCVDMEGETDGVVRDVVLFAEHDDWRWQGKKYLYRRVKIRVRDEKVTYWATDGFELCEGVEEWRRKWGGEKGSAQVDSVGLQAILDVAPCKPVLWRWNEHAVYVRIGNVEGLLGQTPPEDMPSVEEIERLWPEPQIETTIATRALREVLRPVAKGHRHAAPMEIRVNEGKLYMAGMYMGEVKGAQAEKPRMFHVNAIHCLRFVKVAGVPEVDMVCGKDRLVLAGGGKRLITAALRA